MQNESVNGPPGSVRGADQRLAEWVTRRWVRGAVIGAVVGAVASVLLLVLFKDGSLYPAWIGAGLGGLVAGGFVGGFLAVLLGQPNVSHRGVGATKRGYGHS
jgi:integral membrane sensor domain MASE1